MATSQGQTRQGGKGLPPHPCACGSWISAKDSHGLCITCLGAKHAQAAVSNPDGCPHCSKFSPRTRERRLRVAATGKVRASLPNPARRPRRVRRGLAMADLLTVYDDGEANSFIECKVCAKRIRGDTNYKIHMTAIQHYKKEKALADKGFIPQPAPLPQWTSIKDYLLYLNLNEPIIGLGDLVQEEDFVSKDHSTILRYRCRLCAVQMDVFDMTTHVVSRRHRQKYLERHRSDLVTWGKNSEKQAGIVARAKAAIVEKQEGWGNPVPLVRSQKGRSVRNQAGQGRSSNDRGKAPSRHGRSRQSSCDQSYTADDAYRRPSHYHEDDRSYRDNIPDHPSGSGDDRYDTRYSPDDRQRRSYQEGDYMERPWEDEMNVRAFSGERTPDRQTYMDKGNSQFYDDDWYPKENPCNAPYESRAVDDYHRGNISENRFGDPEGDYQESGRMRDQMYMSQHGTGPSMDDRQQQSRNLPYTEREREHFHDLDRTERRGSFEMQDYNKRRSYYPTDGDQPLNKKSRFSDASPREIALSENSDINAMVLKQKRRAGHFMQNQPGGAVTPRRDNVLDVLNDIQIENMEDAHFLKDKLCSLLKEFQSNKDTQGQGLQSPADFTDSYHGITNMEPRRDMPQSRCLDDRGFQEHARYTHDMQSPREYLHTRHVEENPDSMRQNRAHDEPEYPWNSFRESSAGRSEDRMVHRDDRRVYQEATWNSRPLREEDRGYSDQHYQHDNRPSGELYDPFEQSSPPLEISNPTLDKLASTLLELVARKVN